MSTGGLIMVALAIAVGLAGILFPLLPGTLLIWAAIAVWAYLEHTTTGWVVLGVATAVLGAGILVKYLWPARRLNAADVTTVRALADTLIAALRETEHSGAVALG